MVAPTDPRSSLSREMSLRRSFMAIQESAHQAPRPSTSHHGHHRDKAITKSKSYHDRQNVSRRRTSEEIHAAASHKENSPAVAPPPLRVEEVPSLPFSLNSAERHQFVPPAKFQRRRPPLAAVVANEEMAARLMVDDSRPIIDQEHHHHHHHHEGFRKDYRLGDALRSPAHAIQRGLAAVDSLDKYDFAFVKRSDGSFSYAILAFRSLESAGEEEQSMTFVVSAAGSTKTVHRRHWAESVRMVAPSLTPAPVSDEPAAVLCQDIVDDDYVDEDGDDCWVLPGMISFESRAVAADEISLISSVSDRARNLRRGRCQSA